MCFGNQCQIVVERWPSTARNKDGTEFDADQQAEVRAGHGEIKQNIISAKGKGAGPTVEKAQAAAEADAKKNIEAKIKKIKGG